MEDIKAMFDHIVAKSPDYTHIEIEKGIVKVVVKREKTVPAPLVTPNVQAPEIITNAVEIKAPVPNTVIIKSPIVGTFYAASSPDSEPFAIVGKSVKKGDVLCIIEAMKMMNEIDSETDGVISRVLVKNGDLVEYGQHLFEIGV